MYFPSNYVVIGPDNHIKRKISASNKYLCMCDKGEDDTKVKSLSCLYPSICNILVDFL